MARNAKLRLQNEHERTLRQLEGTYLYPFIEKCCRLRANTSIREQAQLWDTYRQTREEDLRTQIYQNLVPLVVKNVLDVQPKEREETVQDTLANLFFYIENAQHKNYESFLTGVYACVLNTLPATSMERAAVQLSETHKAQGHESGDSFQEIERNWSMWEEFNAVLQTLKANEEYVIRRRFGIDTKKRLEAHLAPAELVSFQQIGAELGYTTTYVTQLYRDALKRLRHPSRSKRIKEFI